jgi:hypothetical protein
MQRCDPDIARDWLQPTTRFQLPLTTQHSQSVLMKQGSALAQRRDDSITSRSQCSPSFSYSARFQSGFFNLLLDVLFNLKRTSLSFESFSFSKSFHPMSQRSWKRPYPSDHPYEEPQENVKRQKRAFKALQQLKRRNTTKRDRVAAKSLQTQAAEYLCSCSTGIAREIKSSSRHGGPDLSDLRGVCDYHEKLASITNRIDSIRNLRPHA